MADAGGVIGTPSEADEGELEAAASVETDRPEHQKNTGSRNVP
jgi:hypothetical protein